MFIIRPPLFASNPYFRKEILNFVMLVLE
jgi:hypothetical protein